MFSRIYSILFLLTIIAGVVFQRQYMKDSTAQIKILEARMKADTMLIGVKNLSICRYVSGRRSDKIVAQKGEILTDGSLRLDEDIWFTKYRELDGKVSSRLHSETVFGQMSIEPQSQASKYQRSKEEKEEIANETAQPSPTASNPDLLVDTDSFQPTASPQQTQNPLKNEPLTPSQAFIKNQATLESFHFPKEVSIFLEDGIIKTSNVFFNFPEQLVLTEDAVTYVGKGKDLRGAGMSYKLNTGEFEMGGPVIGRFEPESLATLRALSKDPLKKSEMK